MFQIVLKLMTGDNEIVEVDDKEQVAKIVAQVTAGGWLNDLINSPNKGKLRLINGGSVVKITITEKITYEREVIKK